MKAYYEHGGITIYHGDCREILTHLKPSGAVITDPPYFIPSQTYVPPRGAGEARKMLGDMSILKSYFRSLFEDLPLTPRGSAYMFCNAGSFPLIWEAMYPHFKHVRNLVWDKCVSFNGYTWRRQHELIAWGEGEGAKRVPTGDGDVLKCRGVLQKDRLHPAEKPVDLLSRLVEKSEGVVLDPFCGSGPTLAACQGLGRQAIGIEIEERYCEIAAKRLAQEVLPFGER